MGDAEVALVPRVAAPQLDAVLGRGFPVLDDGFVRAVDYMGADASVVQAARVSYGEGTRKTSQDRALIRYLLRHRHTTPFEMCEIKLHVRVPMDVWRQWIRHRTASVNEYSTRYSLAIDAAHRIAPDAWRSQATSNRQGSGEPLEPALGRRLSEAEGALQQHAREVYEERIEAGVSREQARKDLPLSTYTEAYWKTDLHNLLHFLALRMDSHAQAEIRAYAETIGREIVRRWVPLSWEAFEDYRLNAIALSRDARALLGHVARGDLDGARTYAACRGLLDRDPETQVWRPGREALELGPLFDELGLAAPW